VWGGTLTVNGSAVTVRNAAWNGQLQPDATAQFGFLATGTATTPAVSCAAQ
jgi:endoglucanase